MPSLAPAAATKRAASRVISVKPRPPVSIESVAVATSCGATLVTADMRRSTVPLRRAPS